MIDVDSLRLGSRTTSVFFGDAEGRAIVSDCSLTNLDRRIGKVL